MFTCSLEASQCETYVQLAVCTMEANGQVSTGAQTDRHFQNYS